MVEIEKESPFIPFVLYLYCIAKTKQNNIRKSRKDIEKPPKNTHVPPHPRAQSEYI